MVCVLDNAEPNAPVVKLTLLNSLFFFESRERKHFLILELYLGISV